MGLVETEFAEVGLKYERESFDVDQDRVKDFERTDDPELEIYKFCIMKLGETWVAQDRSFDINTFDGVQTGLQEKKHRLMVHRLVDMEKDLLLNGKDISKEEKCERLVGLMQVLAYCPFGLDNLTKEEVFLLKAVLPEDLQVKYKDLFSTYLILNGLN